jgi:hypothetical protein
MIDLDAIEARAVKAEHPTNGNACTPALGATNKYEISRSESPSDSPERLIGTTTNYETAVFWVWAKHDVLALIARVRELEAGLHDALRLMSVAEHMQDDEWYADEKRLMALVVESGTR